MLRKALIEIERLNEEPYSSILCYPRPSDVELRRRLEELRELRVNAVEFCGEKEVFNLQVLGVGCVGVVVVAHVNGQKAALKIRRVDADRTRMEHEAEMLEKANSVNVGPKFLSVSKNFLLMRFVNGLLFPDWLEKCREKARIRMVLRELLQQCCRLDKIGLDHGELSHAPKHIILNSGDDVFIVDFETASVNRRPSNVTSICQFLFVSSAVAGKVAERLGKKDMKMLIEALKRYKNNRTLENFEAVVMTCDL